MYVDKRALRCDLGMGFLRVDYESAKETLFLAFFSAVLSFDVGMSADCSAVTLSRSLLFSLLCLAFSLFAAFKPALISALLLALTWAPGLPAAAVLLSFLRSASCCFLSCCACALRLLFSIRWVSTSDLASVIDWESERRCAMPASSANFFFCLPAPAAGLGGVLLEAAAGGMVETIQVVMVAMLV